MKAVAYRMAAGLVLCFVSALSAQASAPAERIICTKAPKSEWISEAKIKEIFGEKDFSLVKLKVSRGNCYEFYAVHKDNSVVEAYYDPVTGKAMRYNRVTVTAPEPGYESGKTAPTR